MQSKKVVDMELLEQFGPPYPKLGAAVAKFRKIPRMELSADQKREYAEAIETAIRALQRSALQRELPSFRPRCASGTWHTTGKAIERAIREQHRNALLAYPEQVRKARTPGKWAELYDAAMKEKRKRLKPGCAST